MPTRSFDVPVRSRIKSQMRMIGLLLIGTLFLIVTEPSSAAKNSNAQQWGTRTTAKNRHLDGRTLSLDSKSRKNLQIRGGFRGRNNKRSKEVEQATKSTMASSVFNLVNNVAGAGLLALSAGQAAGTGWIPAIVIAIILGSLSAVRCHVRDATSNSLFCT